MLIVIILIIIAVVYILRSHEKSRKKLSEMTDREIEECKSVYERELKDNIGYGRTPSSYEFSEKAAKYVNWSEKDKFSAEFECITISTGILAVFISYRFMSVEMVMEPAGYFLSLIISIIAMFIAGWAAGSLAAWLVKLMRPWRGSSAYWFYCFMMSAGAVSLLVLMYDYYQANKWRDAEDI